MSKVCYKCAKKFLSGNNVSHSERKTKRRFNPNLQQITLLENGVKKKVSVCARCKKKIA
ncbi:MAG TPA: 50S ribosomal protein L28 [bacterium]|nr:50S ribosomal protein L28 [bacterium]HPN67174.1 50S ribosomal protein L28 [bacterium]